jgi:hypothetical protein
MATSAAAIATPDWLARRDGGLAPDHDNQTWLLMLGGSPQYKLTPAPAAGRFTCHVVQTINGRRLDEGRTYPTAEDAVRGGLEELRSALGW